MRARLALLLLATPLHVGAQRPQPEFRVDAIGPAPYSIQAGAGLTWALGHYARVGVAGGFGGAETRADLTARIALDPFRQRRAGFSIGGGLSIRETPRLLGVVELEGPARAGWLPAVQLGLGGGARAGLILRRAVRGRR